MVYHKIVIVGGGLAGLRAAVETSDMDCAIVSMVHPVRSHSGAAQGGVNAPLGNVEKEDSWEKHAYDTTKGSDFLADQDAVEVMTGEASQSIYELERWGVPFDRTSEGKIAQRPFGGAGFPRTCYAADKTGHLMLHTAYEQTVLKDVLLYEDRMMVSMIVNDRKIRGIITLNMLTGDIECFEADAVILASGGAGQIYGRATSALINTGLPMAIAYWAGVPLKDMEFVQFHPTSLYGTNILMTEGARGEGGYLINNKGERFMVRYAEKSMELAPRDIVARAIETEINEGYGFEGGYVHLDLRHLGREKILERLPGIRDISMNFAGVDPIEEPIPIQPGQHYIMGGIDTDIDGRTVIEGLFAAGECACVSVHGANRLGGNSLLDTLVFGKMAGRAAVEYVKEEAADNDRESSVIESEITKIDEKLSSLYDKSRGASSGDIRNRMKNVMIKKVGIFRKEQDIKEALSEIRRLKEDFKDAGIGSAGKRYNLELIRYLELEGMLDLAEVVAVGALDRKESRGSHFRTDFDYRDDDNWLKHTMAYYTSDGPRLEYEEVTITRFKPEERRY